MAAYLGFREQVSLPEFLDIEEAVIVERDRAEALRVAAEQARGSEAAMRVEAQLAREQETVLRRQAQAREEAALMQSYASDMRQVERAVASSDLSVAR